MKRILLYIAAFALALQMPVERVDIARLRPVQVVCLEREGERLVLQTDTGDTGSGTDVASALADLKATTPAVIYLDTAQYLLVSSDAEEAINDLRADLKKNVRICQVQGIIALEEVAAYLTVHGQLPQLKHWQAGQSLPILTGIENRLILTKKSEKSA